jgi:hypothetical protein
LADIAGNFREAAQISSFISQCRNGNTRPKQRAIFASSPTFTCKMTFCRHDLELSFGCVALKIF